MRALMFAVACAALFAPPAGAEENPLAPLDFLQGCWRGTFAGAPAMGDVHCFAPMLGGRFVRDTHAVYGAPAPYAGETVYAFDNNARRIVFSYYASDGATSQGYVEATAEGLRFPVDRYVGADGGVLIMRTRWVREGADRYTAITEEQNGSAWRESMRLNFVRAPELSSPS